MAETAGSRMIPTFFAACICPWQYFGMKIRKRKRALGHQVNIPSEMVLSDRADGACRPQKWCSAAVCMVHSYGFR